MVLNQPMCVSLDWKGSLSEPEIHVTQSRSGDFLAYGQVNGFLFQQMEKQGRYVNLVEAVGPHACRWSVFLCTNRLGFMEGFQLWLPLLLCSHSGFLSMVVLCTHVHAYSTPAPWAFVRQWKCHPCVRPQAWLVCFAAPVLLGLKYLVWCNGGGKHWESSCYQQAAVNILVLAQCQTGNMGVLYGATWRQMCNEKGQVNEN